MKNKIKVTIVSGCILLLINIIVHLFFGIQFGEPIEPLTATINGETKAYFLEDLYLNDTTEPMTVTFEGEFDRPLYKGSSITLQLPDVMSFELYVNDVLLERLGNSNDPSTYARNHVFVVPLDEALLMDEDNRLKIVTGELDSAMLTFYPEINTFQEATRLASIKNTILNNMFNFMIVFVLLTNIGMYVFIKRNKSYRSFFYRVIAITTLIIIQSLQFFYYPSEFVFLEFFAIKKIANIASLVYIMVTFRLVDLYNTDETKPRYWFVDIPLVISAISILLAPNYLALRIPVMISVVLDAIYLFWLFTRIMKNKFTDFYPIVLVIFITGAELILTYFYMLKNLYLIHIGMTMIILNIYYIGYTYSNRLSEEHFLDQLTGAYNRKHLARIDLQQKHILVFIDLDNFKKYNDTYGHQKGDELLRELVASMKTYEIFHNNIIRYGGDEFILLAKDVEIGIVQETMKELADRTQKKYDFVGISFGVERYTGDLDTTIALADRSMYKNKVVKRTTS